MQHDGVLMWYGGDCSSDYSPEHAPYASPAEFNKDMLLADLCFLSDGVEIKNGIPHQTRDAGREREARSALARLLRAGARKDCGEVVRSFIRSACSQLADLVDPENKFEPFELVLSRRGRKGPVASSKTFDCMIAYYICDQAAQYSDRSGRGQMKATIDDAMNTFGVSRAKAYSAWRKYRHEAENARIVRYIASQAHRHYPDLEASIDDAMNRLGVSHVTACSAFEEYRHLCEAMWENSRRHLGSGAIKTERSTADQIQDFFERQSAGSSKIEPPT